MSNNQRKSYDIDAIFRLSHRDALPTLLARLQSVEHGGGKLSVSERMVLAVLTTIPEVRRRGFADWYSNGGAHQMRQTGAWLDTQDLPATSSVFKQAIQLVTYREKHARTNLDGTVTLTERDEKKLAELDQMLDAVAEDFESRLYRFVYVNQTEFGNC